MTITIELNDELAKRLKEEAKRLNLTVSQVAELGIVDFLFAPDARFEKVTDQIIEKNRELYRRLAG